MDRTPIKNEFARTSTPRYSFYDSGFYGSGIKAYPNPIYSLSPIKENTLDFKEDEFPFSHDSFHTFTPLKLHYSSTYDSNRNLIQIGKSDIIKQLSFDDSGFGNDSYNQQVRHSRVCPKKVLEDKKSDSSCISPCYTSSPRARPRINFLTRLKKMNCERIISDLLSYLPAEDLCRMSCVSKMWKELIVEDVKANGRRREYLKSIKAHRENKSKLGISPCDIKKRYERLSSLPKLVLNDITNRTKESKISTRCCDPRFESFVKEGNIVDGPLMKCPNCKYAAKRKENDEYICTNCNYMFCKKCLSPSSKYHKCPILQVPTLFIGSKQCKRNLKRL